MPESFSFRMRRERLRHFYKEKNFDPLKQVSDYYRIGGKDIYVILNCLGLDAYLGWYTKETDSYLEELVRETTDS